MARPKVPGDLRERLESARLDGLALVRALDQLDLTPGEIPQHLLRDLFELDADFAEALWALDQRGHALDVNAMVRDTLASLQRLPAARDSFLAALPQRVATPLADRRRAIRPGLTQADAYRDVKGSPHPFG